MNQLFTKILYGILLWGLVYLASLPMLPLIKTDPFFFKTLIGFVFTVFAIVFTVLFFANVKENYLSEGISAGIIWMLISIAIDIVVFVYGKSNMSFSGYFKDIGLTYVAFPITTIGVGYLLERFQSRNPKSMI
jgi:hypothetical protein